MATSTIALVVAVIAVIVAGSVLLAYWSERADKRLDRDVSRERFAAVDRAVKDRATRRDLTRWGEHHSAQIAAIKLELDGELERRLTAIAGDVATATALARQAITTAAGRQGKRPTTPLPPPLPPPQRQVIVPPAPVAEAETTLMSRRDLPAAAESRRYGDEGDAPDLDAHTRVTEEAFALFPDLDDEPSSAGNTQTGLGPLDPHMSEETAASPKASGASRSGAQ